MLVPDYDTMMRQVMAIAIVSDLNFYIVGMMSIHIIRAIFNAFTAGRIKE